MAGLKKPIFIAGPCLAESYELLEETLLAIKSKLDPSWDFYFKASFDKANRTSITSYRGPGIEKALTWFEELKSKHNIKILTDIHESWQAQPVAEICDGLQIPAFLCRQTDLLLAAVETGRFVNIKKGQFISAHAMKHAVYKAKEITDMKSIPLQLGLTERGAMFGYGDLVVDMRSFKILAENDCPVIFDLTHSVQKPPMDEGTQTKGAREFIPLLMRAALATGYVGGLFMEVHPCPKNAKSDSQTQLSIPQAHLLMDYFKDHCRQKQNFEDHLFI